MLKKLKSAVKSRKKLLVKKILQEDQPPLDSQEGGEILWRAVLDNELQIASMLVLAGANLSVCKPGCILKWSFLHVLAGSLDPRHHRLALLMLDCGADQGADVNARDVHTNGVLHHAIRAHNSAIGFIRELLNRGCCVTLDIIATAVQHPLALQLLPLLIVAGNADDDTRKERVITALNHLSFYSGKESEILSVVKMLLDMTIPMEIKRNVDIFGNAILTKKIQMVKLLIAHGFDVTNKLKSGYTALHTACIIDSSIDMIKLLVLHGADFNVVGIDQRTAFIHLRCQEKMNDKTRFAIKHLAISTVKGFTIENMNLIKINHIPERTKFYEQCQKKLELMKFMTVFNDTTFFSILSNNFKRLSFLIRNKMFAQSYINSVRKRDFPIFYDELVYVFEAAKQHRNMLLKKEKALCEVLENIVPYVPLEKIIYHFYMNEN